MSKKNIFIIFVLFFSVQIHSQTVSWATPPTYESLEEYAGTLYKIRENGKVGLADISGKVLVSASYDSITPFHEHLALALEYAGGKYAVKGIVNQHNYSMVKVANRYYVTDKYPFFSEGKLVVYDDSNKYGYLLPDGSMFKACQYHKTFPFYVGLACIHKKKDEVAYLKSDGNELITQLENDGYILLTGSSFNENGEAYVQGKAMGVKRCIIDTQGNILREAKYAGREVKNYKYRKPIVFSSDQQNSLPLDGVNPFLKEKHYGFSSNNSTVVLPAQFSEATSFRGGYAKVKKNDKYGILKLQPGSFTARLDKNIIKVENGKSETVNYLVSIPSEYTNRPVTVQLAEKEGVVVELNPIVYGSGEKAYPFTPSSINKETKIVYRFYVQTDGILLWEDTQQIDLQYIKTYPPVLSSPQVTGDFKMDAEGYIRADSNNKVDVYATIENKSSEILYMTVTIGGNGVVEETKNISVAPNSSVRISTYINAIKERKMVEVFVKTSTGLAQSKVIKVKPFI